jgi:hypothetical protein
VEASSQYHGRLVAKVAFHPLIACLHRAFNDHRPVSLSPDMIWLLICQGVADHINVNAEKLRSRFVQHAGKIVLTVRRDDFIKGSPENPWAEVFPEFTRQIRDHIGRSTHDFFTPCFSTTGATEKAAFELALMDAMQSYFDYRTSSICGIPAITLEGTADDWRVILDRVDRLPEFDLAWWLPVLKKALGQFVEAADGRPDMDFWQSLYKYQTVSGGSRVTGWINAFFPYFHNSSGGTGQNPSVAQWAERMRRHADGTAGPIRYPGHGSYFESAIDRFPCGLARVPLLWQYASRQFTMHLVGGFVGVFQEPETLCLRPQIGWAVVDDPDPSTGLFGGIWKRIRNALTGG